MPSPDTEAKNQRVISADEILFKTFAADICLWCGGGASVHQVRLNQDGESVVECVDAHGYIL